jgi:hypothetical protein
MMVHMVFKIPVFCHYIHSFFLLFLSLHSLFLYLVFNLFNFYFKIVQILQNILLSSQYFFHLLKLFKKMSLLSFNKSKIMRRQTKIMPHHQRNLSLMNFVYYINIFHSSNDGNDIFEIF